MTDLRQLVEKHRRHVEQSPGVGPDVQRYALAVCDDILSDLDALLVSQGWQPIEQKEESTKKI